jgi:hypothetical protein
MKIILSICVFAAAVAFAVETNLTLTVDGVTYTGVRFGRATPGSVVVFHSTGVATIPLEKLSAELQKQFDYDPQKAAVWRVLQQKAAEAQRKADAEAAEANRKAATTVEWTLTVERVLPDGIVARGCRTSDLKLMLPPPPSGLSTDNRPSASTPYCPNPVTICLVDDPHVVELAEGNKFTARAYKEGVIIIEGRSLEQWMYYDPLHPKPASPPSIQPPISPPVPPAPSGAFAELRDHGAFGFPQEQARVLWNHPALRFSVWNNDQYLFAQAVLWMDGDSSTITNEAGYVLGDASELWLDLGADGKMTTKVDREYVLNVVPSWPGMYYRIPMGKGATSGQKPDTQGWGAIRYLDIAPGKRVRADTFLIPLAELSKQVGDRIRLCYWGRSPRPSFMLSSLGHQDTRALQYRDDEITLPKSCDYILATGGLIDPAKVPDGRADPLSP